MSNYNAMRRTKVSELQLKQHLKDCGLKWTSTRWMILKAFLENEKPISAEKLYEEFQKKKQNCDLVTIYRNLKTFEDAGLILRLDLGLNRDFFELQLSDPQHHHHILCRTCHKIEHVDICGLGPHVKFLESLGFSEIQHRLEFSGLCRQCG